MIVDSALNQRSVSLPVTGPLGIRTGSPQIGLTPKQLRDIETAKGLYVLGDDPQTVGASAATVHSIAYDTSADNVGLPATQSNITPILAIGAPAPVDSGGKGALIALLLAAFLG